MANKYSEFSKTKHTRRELYKRIRRQEYGCIRKRKFDTKDNAMNSERCKVLDLVPYRCPSCNYWHLTKRVKNERKG